jgi:hypothetical protein
MSQDWKVNVNRSEFDGILKRLETDLALNQGLGRGWFTYTELGNLTNSLLSWSVIWPMVYEHCLKVCDFTSFTRRCSFCVNDNFYDIICII